MYINIQQGYYTKKTVLFTPKQKISVNVYTISKVLNGKSGRVKSSFSAFKYKGNWYSYDLKMVNGKLERVKGKKIPNPESQERKK